MPRVEAEEQVRTTVDAFVFRRLEVAGIQPALEADRVTLIRRLTFDLIGLPPTPDEIDAFVSDTEDGAYERLVNRLLDSRHYGERWGRHWLDLARYADTSGYESNILRPYAFHYRDYVISAFNQDMPYDRFIVEQIAIDARNATSFLVCAAFDNVTFRTWNELQRMQVRQDELHEFVNTTTQTFLGLTVACSRCHDHKFDPITQQDYYALQAVFDGIRHPERTITHYPFRDELKEKRSEEESRKLLAELEEEIKTLPPAPQSERRMEVRSMILALRSKLSGEGLDTLPYALGDLMSRQIPTPLGSRLSSRRHFLSELSTGAAGVALAGLLNQDESLAATAAANSGPIVPQIDPANSQAARRSHLEPRAKQLLVIFCNGGVSQVDSWDYKPELIKRHETPHPDGASIATFQAKAGNLIRSIYPFRPRGESGKQVTDMLPQLAELTDEMCFLHAMHTRSNSHGPAETQMSTGFFLSGYPSAGSWITYALGTENDNLPAFIAITDPRGGPQAGSDNWSCGFLPAVFQGTEISSAKPVYNLQRPGGISEATDIATRGLLQRLNRDHLQLDPANTELQARIASYELAAKMQLSVPSVLDLSSETQATLDRYAASSPDAHKAGYARNCILARRLLGNGVRVVQLQNGTNEMGEGNGNWDGHKYLAKQYDVHRDIFDQPTVALLTDMKQRGLLEHTLVLWCTEFGRMPVFQAGASGRDHNPHGFTVWLAGAGVKAPFSHGATDEFGYKAAENRTSVHDLYATVLHLLGLDFERLSFRHNGNEQRLTDVHGYVIREILG